MNQSTYGALRAPGNSTINWTPIALALFATLFIIVTTWIQHVAPLRTKPVMAKPADCWIAARHGDSPKGLAQRYGDHRLVAFVGDQAHQPVTIAGRTQYVLTEGQAVNVCP